MKGEGLIEWSMENCTKRTDYGRSPWEIGKRKKECKLRKIRALVLCRLMKNRPNLLLSFICEVA